MKKIGLLTLLFVFLSGACWADVDQATGSGAISETYTKNNGGSKLVGFRLHLSAAAATSENFVVYIDSSVSSAYDVVIYTKDMAGVQDIEYRFNPPYWPGGSGDVFTFTYANSDSRTYGLESIYQK